MNPLTPPSINRIPGGLLGFLGIKNGGRNPDALAGYVQGCMDLTDWYLQTNRLYMRTGINIAALNFTNFYTAPPGEFWYIQHASFITSVLGAGQTIQAVPCVQDASGLRQVAVADTPAAATVGAVFSVQARDFWVMPGESLGIYTTQLAAGPIVAPIFTVAFNILTA